MIKNEPNIYRPFLTAVDVKEAKRYAGLRKGQVFPEEIVQEACNIVMMYKAPQAVWQVYAYDAKQGIVLAPTSYTIPSKNLCKHLGSAEQVVFLAATAGEMVEEAATEAFNKGNYALGLLIDAAATAIVEQIADETEKLLINRFAKAGFGLITRFSPGYGDWDLQEQVSVASLAQAEAIGVTLTESLMLMPRKSITAIIGLTTANEKAQGLQGCAGCTKSDCTLRKG
ncbi:MAG TPA: methionine synthase [Candidatus Avacidaminococcus intestinavium]|uniref:Methionine synthase n=1 Tax=Candidatus Avacidaminococcus intestinavium TaxID=2840684 RepID=A0A9D1MQQ5_9FIRM|nr:methionine synthase [Candidatus Avacidaminococcus intestinavium]